MSKPKPYPTAESIQLLFKSLYAETNDYRAQPEEEKEIHQKLNDMVDEVTSSSEYKTLKRKVARLERARNNKNKRLQKRISQVQDHYRLQGPTEKIQKALQKIVDEIVGPLTGD